MRTDPDCILVAYGHASLGQLRHTRAVSGCGAGNRSSRERLGHSLKSTILGLTIMFFGLPQLEAFKIDTHVWIAQAILNDLTVDGRLSLGDLGEFQVRPELLQALQTYPDAYRLGSVGPDGFPDLIGGQMTTHPGPSEEWAIPYADGWVTDDWLRWVLRHAKKPEEIAFAHGYLTHAASDVFAHTYVNTYAGDTFDFQDELEVELRHMALENYILKHQPPLRDYFGIELHDADAVDMSGGLASWIAATLIMNDDVARQYQGAGVTHLKGMQDLLNKLDGALVDAEEAHDMINGGVKSLRKKVSALRNKKVKIDLGWFGSYTVSLFPAYCFVDPGTCSAVLVTEGHLAAVERVNQETLNQGLKPLRDWRQQVQHAVEAYCVASREVAVELLRDPEDHTRPPFPAERDPFRPIRQWAICWGPAFAGVPAGVTDPTCKAGQGLSSLLTIKDRYRAMEASLTGKLRDLEWLLAPHNALRRVQDRLNEILQENFSRIASDISGENSLVFDMIQLREEQNLVEIFSGDSSGKGLRVFTDIEQRVWADMGISSEDELWNSWDYAVVAHAITLSKLLLLDAAELNRLASRAGVTCSILGPSPFIAEPEFNVLLGFIRSIDGNHQWQEYGIPYPRQEGWDGRPKEERHFGYRWGEQAMSSVAQTKAQPGFLLWQDGGLREKVFLRLFSKPLLAQDLLPTNYAAASSPTNPFPFAVESKQPDPVEDCLNSFLLTSESATDLVFAIPSVGCVPAGAEDVRYNWGFIDDCEYICVTPASYEESLAWDRSASADWTVTSPCLPLVPGLAQFSGSLDAMAERFSENATHFLESQSFDQNAGLLTIRFHTRHRVPTLGAGRWDLPENAIYDGNMICRPKAANPVFIKGSVEDMLLELTVSWAAEGLGGILGQRETCVVRYRIIEARSASLADVTNWESIGMSPCDVPPNSIVPVSPLDHSTIRSARDRLAPLLKHEGDLELVFGERDWTMQDIAMPKLYDDWHRSDELTVSHDAPSELALGTTVVNWTVSDPEGNVVRASQKITVSDLVPPRFAGGTQALDGEFILEPVEFFQEMNGFLPTDRLPAPSVVDDYPGVTVSMVDPPDLFPLGETLVTWLARDASGNEAEAQQHLRVLSLLGDVDLDGDVDDDDAAITTAGVGQTALGVGNVELEDFNGDGRIDSSDEILRNELQVHIDSMTADLRDLDQDGQIALEDVTLLRANMTRDAQFSFESDFTTPHPNMQFMGDAALSEGAALLSTSQSGTLIVIPPSNVRRVTSLDVSFRVQFAGGTFPSGEGLSFSFAPDLPQMPFGTEGAGSALRVSLHFGDSRAAPSVNVWFGEDHLGASGPLSFLKGESNPLEVRVRITSEQTLSIWLNNQEEHLILSDLPGYQPTIGSFAIGGRTTRLSDAEQWIDDLVLHAVYEPTLLPPALLITRGQNDDLRIELEGFEGESYRLEISSDLVNWALWDTLTISDPQGVEARSLTIQDDASVFLRAVAD